MTRVGRTLGAVLVWSAIPASVFGQSTLKTEVAGSPPLAPIVVRADVNRTAVWVGDDIVYSIELMCPPGTDIIVEDLSRDRIRLQALDLSDAQVARETRSDGTVIHRARFRMVAYGTDAEALRIEPLTVRYYIRRAGDRLEDLTPAGELELPAVDIALRSTLPDGGPTGIRDDKTLRVLPSWLTLLRPFGLTLVGLSFAPVLLGIAAAIARRRGSTAARRAKRRTPKENLANLDAIRNLGDTTNGDTRREAFDRLDGLLRGYLTDLDIPALSLTPAEVAGKVAQSHPALDGEIIASVLRDCQRARYGGADQLPNGETLARALNQTGEVLAASSR